MARGIDESRNPNRQVGPDKWHRIKMLDRTTPERWVAAGGYKGDLQYNPIAKRKAAVYGRPYEVSPGKYGFEWEYRDVDTGEALSNTSNLERMREIESIEASNASMADSYYRSARDDAAREHYGLDYNEYRAWKAGEGPEEDYLERELYQDPEGWQSWSSDKHYVGEPKGNHLSNVEGTRHRLKDVYGSRSQARRQGRKFLNSKDYYGRTGYIQYHEPEETTGWIPF